MTTEDSDLIVLLLWDVAEKKSQSMLWLTYNHCVRQAGRPSYIVVQLASSEPS